MTLIELFNRHTPEEIYAQLRLIAKDLQIPQDPLTATPTPAAVLIPLIEHPEPTILLTQRTIHLSSHPGQISFPGGRMDTTDIDLAACALRETHEEVGINADKIVIATDLGLWPSYTGYVVKPFIGIIKPPVEYTPCSYEVAEIFEVPLSVIRDLNRYELVQRETPIPHHYYQLVYQDKVIWGLTAGLLRLLAAYLSLAPSLATP